MRNEGLNLTDIVRCKDCKHRGHFENKSKVYPDYVCPARCEDDYYSWIPNDNWFCANGEKHDEQSNTQTPTINA